MDKELKTFLVSYRHDGAEWNVEVPARDFDDARARLVRLAHGTVEGEMMATFPAATGPLVTFLAFTRNAFRYFLRPSP